MRRTRDPTGEIGWIAKLTSNVGQLSSHDQSWFSFGFLGRQSFSDYQLTKNRERLLK